MNFNNDLEKEDSVVGEVEEKISLSIEDFIKELEAKEKDLQISSDLAIEIGDSEFDDSNPPEFIKAEFAIEPVKAAAEKPPVSKPVSNEKKASEFEGEILQLKKQILKLEAERSELAEASRRRQLDFDNFKKRVERDRSETFLAQISNLAKQMLPVLDNMNRALDFASNHGENRSQDFHQFFEGIVMVNQQLNEVLAEMGVQPIPSVGEPFDPHFHEAVATEVSAEFPPNTVTGELLSGYRIGDRVIRAAMVKVSTSAAVLRPQPKAAPAPANTPNPAETVSDPE
jgi:molecular chaperone GrpE